MKHLPNIAGGLLGFMFIAFGAMFLLNLIPPEAQTPPPAEEIKPAVPSSAGITPGN